LRRFVAAPRARSPHPVELRPKAPRAASSPPGPHACPPCPARGQLEFRGFPLVGVGILQLPQQVCSSGASSTASPWCPFSSACSCMMRSRCRSLRVTAAAMSRCFSLVDRSFSSSSAARDPSCAVRASFVRRSSLARYGGSGRARTRDGGAPPGRPPLASLCLLAAYPRTALLLQAAPCVHA